ncbi:proline-serine-threonine phosphatase-interacting protein 1-like isoform X2 [Mizuhopecten yessoensis]|uniref:proline-serine-threonine phosphatase-interacting protein 1-like isoform X2 n=1 Tax=Mizuhopecten yessoensis TaxID=6573 RepID=UPI000B457321|nr:proline-serine-threonine phosphatase-interacting protein 1-like isoform X2 [Mizuhopecten yessoensis]
MTETCVEFQKMEEERIFLTRNILWKITNVDSEACVTQDNCAEKVRNVLEKCEIETDLQAFIDNYGVGKDHPERVPYVSYYERKTSQSNAQNAGAGGTRARQPLPSVPKTAGGGGGPRSPPPGPARPPAPKQAQLISIDDDGPYASISTESTGKRMACVTRAHEAKNIVTASERL